MKKTKTSNESTSKNNLTEDVCRQTLGLSTDVSLHFFNPVIQQHELQNCFNNLKPIFCNLLQFAQASVPVTVKENYRLDLHVNSKLHPAMLKEYTPVVMTGDGNCLWNSILICLFGDERLAHMLRFLTVYVMWENRSYFLNRIGVDTIQEGRPVESFDRYLRIGRVNGEWGNEFHLLALSIALQRDIFSYSSFSSETGRWFIAKKNSPENLANAFRTRRRGTGGQLIFCPPQHLKNANYGVQPICIHYDACGKHYTAVLPKKSPAVEFRPYTNFFS